MHKISWVSAGSPLSAALRQDSLRILLCSDRHPLDPVCTRAQLRFSIWRDLLAPLQIARIYVHAYPNSIDVVALAKCAEWCPVIGLCSNWLL